MGECWFGLDLSYRRHSFELLRYAIVQALVTLFPTS